MTVRTCIIAISLTKPVPGNRLGPIRATTPRRNAAPITTTYSDLARAVKEHGLLSRTRWYYLILFAGLVVALALVGASFVVLGNTWYQLIVAGALGVIFTQFAFLAHEASHRQVFASGPANDRAGRWVGTFVVGISYTWWMNKHSRHHGNPNRIGKDPDIDVDTISFTEDSAAAQRGLLAALTRRQGYLFFPLLTLEGVNLHLTSVRSLFARRPVKGRATELAIIGTRFALYLGVVFWFLPFGMACAFLGVQLAVFGIYMGASFAPNHKGMPIIRADATLDFFRKQVLTSRNITGGWWASALLGGLNYQAEHHLFPNMPRPHLAKARILVQEHCRANEIAYTETSLIDSYGIVIRYLNRVGLAARDPFECPLVKQYR